jgi:3D (Asp-Asp-Asp) domain-containing protein
MVSAARVLPLVLALGACSSSSGGVSGSADAGDDGAALVTGGDAGEAGSPARDGGDDAAGLPAAEGGSGTDSGPDGSGGDSGSTANDAAIEAGTMMSVYVTFYGWADNSPPGGAIAYPMNGGFPTLHDTAGGTGTYADPITFATDKDEFPVGTRLYVPFIEKYVMMEDDCVECDSDWTTSHKWHIDLWMNSNGTESSSALQTCEGNWTRTSTPIEVDPPAGRTVTTAPLFVPSSNTCRTTP